MTSLLEAARKLATADCLWPDPDNWEKLTFGEQHRYYVEAMRKAGKAAIPDDLTDAEGRYLQREIIKAVGWILRWRDMNGGGPQP